MNRFHVIIARLLVAAGYALLFISPIISIPLVPTAHAASQPQLSTPVALTSLAVGGTPTVWLDSQDHFHLLYTTTTPQNQINLVYRVVNSDGQSVQDVRRPTTLSHAADRIDSAVLVVDSRGRLHASWIEVRNGTFFLFQALVEDSTTSGGSNTPKPEMLYQSTKALQTLSGGADSNGNTFYGWLDSNSGSPNLSTIEIRDDQSTGSVLQLTHQTDALNFLHLLVYPDSTLAAVMLQPSPKGGWDVTISPFDATGSALHDPTQVATQLIPGSLNLTGRTNDVSDFGFDPLAATLDAQQHLHIAWGAILQLGYADVTMQPDHSFISRPTMLSTTTNNYQQLCLSAGPATPPSGANNPSSSIWLAWLDDSQQTPVTPLHPYIDQINAQGALMSAPLLFADKNTASSTPCVEQDQHGGLYATWQQYNDSGDYVLMMVTTTHPPQEPFWVKIGLNRNNPIQQILFLLLGSTLLGALGLLPNLLVAPVAAGVVRFGTRLHVHRLALLLLSLAIFVAIDVWFQSFMSDNFSEPVPTFIWAIIAASASLLLIVYLWFRSRRFPPETLGAIGQLFLASYLATIIISIPLIYPFTQHLS